MATTFVPGSKGTVTINSDPIITGQTAGLNRSRNAKVKNTIGAPAAFAIAGQESATFDVTGHVTVEQLQELEAIYASLVPVTFTIQVGDGSGATDSGLYTGSLVADNLNVTVTADAEWDYSMTALCHGLVVYSAPTP